MKQFSLDLSQPQQAHVAERLERETMLWLGSVRPDGRPHLVAVWFLWEGATILLFSKPDQKIRNLRQHPAVIVSLDNTAGGSDVVVLEGEAELLPPSTVNTTLPAYAAKYESSIAHLFKTPEVMAGMYTEAVRIRLTRLVQG